MTNNSKEYIGGKEDWIQVAEIAKNCLFFCTDSEDEWTADELFSCYNCKYRRWTAQSFICCKL